MKDKMNETTKFVFVKPGEKYCPEKEEFKKNLNELFLIIEDAHYAYEIWWILVAGEFRKKYFRIYIHFKEFFEPVAKANFTMMVIALFKLYEEKNNRLSFIKLLKNTKNLKLINPTTNKKLRRKLQEARKIWEKICILRHNLLAHRNYSLTIKEIYKLAEINPNQIKRMIDLSIKIFNTIWMKIEKYPRRIDNFTTRDTLKVLYALKKIFKAAS